MLSADAFSMSSVIRRVPSREDKTVAARGARDLLRAYDADPASVSLEQLEAVVSQVLRGGGLRSRVSAAGTSVSLPQGTPLIDRVREHLQAVDGLEVDRPLEEGACGSIASSSILSPLSVCHCTETTASRRLWGGIVAPAVAEQPLAVTGALVARARECSASGS